MDRNALRTFFLAQVDKNRLNIILWGSPSSNRRKIASRTRCSGSRGPEIAKMLIFFVTFLFGTRTIRVFSVGGFKNKCFGRFRPSRSRKSSHPCNGGRRAPGDYFKAIFVNFWAIDCAFHDVVGFLPRNLENRAPLCKFAPVGHRISFRR